MLPVGTKIAIKSVEDIMIAYKSHNIKYYGYKGLGIYHGCKGVILKTSDQWNGYQGYSAKLEGVRARHIFIELDFDIIPDDVNDKVFNVLKGIS